MDKSRLMVISYDISEDRRRTQIHKALKSYGQWMQYSLFECTLTEMQKVRLWNRLDQLIEPASDNIRLYHLCESCARKVERIGGDLPQEENVFFV
jgi:CRISPR-associated protein Cas2